MSAARIVKNAVMLCFLNVCLSYEHYALSSDKFFSLIGKKRRIRVKDRSESAVVIKATRSFEEWHGIVEYKCRFEVKSEDDNGLIAVIQNISFRSDASGCIDYIQFKRKDGSKSRKYCGQIHPFKQIDEDVEVPDGDVGAVLDPGGELDTTIYVAKMNLNPNERLNLEIVYTSYKECSRSDSIYVSCFPHIDICIWRGLFNDSYVNCPLNCFDEEHCYRAPGGTRTSHIGIRATVGAVASILLAFILFITCLWLLRRGKILCWSNACSNVSHPTPPTSRVELHPSLQDEEMRNYPAPSAPPDSQESSSITITQDKDLPPPYESLFPGR